MSTALKGAMRQCRISLPHSRLPKVAPDNQIRKWCGWLLSHMQRQRILEMAVGEETFAMHVDEGSQFRNHAARQCDKNLNDSLIPLMMKAAYPKCCTGPHHPMGQSRAEPVQQRLQTRQAKECCTKVLLMLLPASPYRRSYLHRGSWMFN